MKKKERKKKFVENLMLCVRYVFVAIGKCDWTLSRRSDEMWKILLSTHNKIQERWRCTKKLKLPQESATKLNSRRILKRPSVENQHFWYDGKNVDIRTDEIEI